MKKQISEWIETLPYPAVAMTDEKNGMSRNRLARRLLPPASVLRGQLSKLRDEFMKELLLDGIPYLVLSLPTEESRVFCFFEHFLPLQEGISRAVVEKMQSFFWSLLSEDENAGKKDLLRMDQIAARARCLRMHGENYLRLINKAKLIENEAPETCSLNGFFEHLHKALEVYGISVSVCDCKDLTVCSESEALSFLVLNLIHFAYLFEAKRSLSLDVKAEGERVSFSMKISDGGAVKSALEELILHDRGSEELLYTLPMLCVLRVCMEKGIPWAVSAYEEGTNFSFSLEKGKKEAVLFLTEAVAEEVSELLQMIKGMFS